jgi:hypothetical protein
MTLKVKIANERIDSEHAIAVIGVDMNQMNTSDLGTIEPFLDTEYIKERAEKIESELSSVGMNPPFVKALRSEVLSMMKAYNFDSMLWDWAYLDIFDLLSAARGTLSGPQYAMDEKQFFNFYFRVMNIALQGQRNTAQRTSHNNKTHVMRKPAPRIL